MPCCPSSCHESCPETTPVTVIQNNLIFDGDNLYAHEVRYSRAIGNLTAASSRYVLMTLPYAPISDAHVFVFANSGAMRGGGIDYVVSGNQVYLVNEAAVDSEYLVKWQSLESSTSSVGAGTTWATGDLQAFFADPGAGWLLMDGSASREKAAYSVLWDLLASTHAALVLSSTSTHFVLKPLTSPVLSGAVLENVPMYVKV